MMAMVVIAMMATMTMMICIMTEALLGWGPYGNAHKSVAPPSYLDHTNPDDHLSKYDFDFDDHKILLKKEFKIPSLIIKVHRFSDQLMFTC